MNSLAVRFGFMAAFFSAICLTTIYFALERGGGGVPFPLLVQMAVVVTLIPAMVTYLAGRRLAGAILQLKECAEAILAGELDKPVDVDLYCEVGELADSFRAMVSRLNNNILRMNVLAYTDVVTGLPNRAVVSHALDLVTRGVPDDGAELHAALLFIDLDGFKRVNDTLGHEAGDELLRLVTERIIKSGLILDGDGIDRCTTSFGELAPRLSGQPVFARFAGDEFVILLPGKSEPAELDVIARRILTAIAQPFMIRESEIRISASIGVARTPFDTCEPSALLSFADLAMYSAKEAGKNRVHFFDGRLERVVAERSSIEAGLRGALEREEFVLHYQPRLKAMSLELDGVEALIRWNHPQWGLIMPDRFMQVAEQCGLMPEIGDLVLRLAARQASCWGAEGLAIPISVNLSSAQFERPNFVQEIVSVLKRHGVSPAMLELEVTEAMVMGDYDGGCARLQQLRDVGFRIAIDDFGAGISNLAQLSKLPFNYLKIDRELVSKVCLNQQSEAIVSAAIGMAHGLGRQVIAEGIELESQHDFLLREGCDMVQGHLFASAMPAGMLVKWQSVLPNSDRPIEGDISALTH